MTTAQLDRAIAAARLRQAQGYFTRAKAGDQRAASLFVRLVALDLNPFGHTDDYGWLTKQPGESQVDGWTEDSIVFGADPTDLSNVVDLVNGAGAPGASIGGSIKPRRPANLWAAPKPLTAEEMAYISGPVVVPVPPVVVQPYPSESPDGGWWGQVADVQIAATYARVNRPYPSDQKSLRWIGRIAYDIRDGLTQEASLAKHVKELEQELGL